MPSVSHLSAKEVVKVRVFTVFIFPSETINETRLFQIKVRLHYYYYDYFSTFFYHVFTTCSYSLQSGHHAVAMLHAHLVFCCTDSIPRRCSHIYGDSLALCNLCWFVVTASELDQPYLSSLSVAGWGRLHLGVAYWAILQ